MKICRSELWAQRLTRFDSTRIPVAQQCCLDAAFDEDHNRTRWANGQANLVVLRQMALTLLLREKTDMTDIKTKRMRAGWDNDYLLKVFTG